MSDNDTARDSGGVKQIRNTVLIGQFGIAGLLAASYAIPVVFPQFRSTAFLDTVVQVSWAAWLLAIVATLLVACAVFEGVSLNG
jgi:hypothetical protein